MGLVVLAGWHSGHLDWCQGWWAGPPMEYNAALGIVVAGACLIATAFEFRRSACAAVLLMLLGSAGVAQDATGIDFGLDRFFFDSNAIGSSSGRIAPSTGFCFVLSGLSLIALNTKPRRLASLSLTGVAAVAVLALAGVIVASYASIVPGIVADPFTSMASLTALSFLIVALGVTALVWREARIAQITTLSWTPFPVAISGCLLSLVLWHALAAQERSHLRRSAQAVTIIVKDELRIRLYNGTTAMTALSRQWDGSNPRPKRRQEFEEEIGPHRNLQGLQSLALIDAKNEIRWMAPQNDAGQILKDAAWEKNWQQYLEKSRTDGRRAWSFSFAFANGQSGLAAVLSERRKDGKTDYLVGIFRAHELFACLLADSLPPGFTAAVVDGANPLFWPGADLIPQDSGWKQSLRVESNGAMWDIHVWPTTAFLAERRSSLPNVVLAAGCLTSFLMGFALFFAGVARIRARRAEEAQRNLVQEVEQRTRAQEALRDSEARYRQLFEGNPQPLWVYDRKTFCFLAVNTAAIQHFGYPHDDFLTMTIADIHVREDVLALVDYLNQAQSDSTRDWRVRKKDGGLIHVQIASRDFRFMDHEARLVIAKDVTAQKKLEENLRQASKMEAVGRLAGGIAHDFNNLLLVIGGYADIIGADLGARSKFGEMIEQIHKAADRAATLTQQLLAFSRKQILTVEVLDLNAVITDLTKMLPRVLEENIELIVRPSSSGFSHVKCDRCQLEQAIINLAANARDAMPQGGKLFLEVESVEVDDSVCGRFPDVCPGSFVRLQVRDTGEGIDAAVLEHIFEPFFTTKEVGQGTGLGLAMVYGLVKQSGGFIEVESDPGIGTTFRLFLPACEAGVERDRKPENTAAQLQGDETILLVEDEIGVRSLAQYVLTQQGYEVLAAASGAEALRLSDQYVGEIDLLIADVVMPEISGPQVAHELSPSRPRMKILFVSGHTEDAVLRHGISEENTPFLAKPFSPRSLACKVRAVLDREFDLESSALEGSGTLAGAS